jgi:predicted deacetylase
MIPRPAQYLLRFDDLCPTMSRRRWASFEELIAEFQLQPILAIVPDNADPELAVDPPDPYFWSRMRSLQSSGAAVALHGFAHVCSARGRSLLPIHRCSEFAGVSEDLQRQWISLGQAILRENGLQPQLFAAPRHGFDRNTLRALRAEGLTTISDGFARTAHSRSGLNWIPQQLWAPQLNRSGLWTICIHPNTASDQFVDRLRGFVCLHTAQFTSLNRVLREWPPQPLSLRESFYEQVALRRFSALRRIRKWLVTT